MTEPDSEVVTDPAEIRRLQLEARKDPWGNNEAVTRARLRAAGRRTLGENLSRALALSEVTVELERSLQVKREAR